MSQQTFEDSSITNTNRSHNQPEDSMMEKGDVQVHRAHANILNITGATVYNTQNISETENTTMPKSHKISS
jgi:hypothetical protein